MDSETLWLFIKLITLLPLVLVLAYLTIKYGLARNRGITAGGRRLRLVEYLPLGPKGGLALVELAGRYYLVAYQEKGITLLKEFAELPDPAAVPTAGPGNDFAKVLAQQWKQLSQQYLPGRHRQEKSRSGCQASDQADKQ
ncbi:hypothetical protein JCM39194_12170 [Desulfotomaculum varum]